MKIIIETIILIMAILMPVTTSAYDFELDGIYYNVNGNQATVTYKTTSYNSYTGNVTIPETINYSGTEYQVTLIGTSAFRKSSGLKNITIPNSVISIDNYAFFGCNKLTNVTIGESVTTIGNYAFDGCSGLTSIKIPNLVTSIGNYAFRDCNTLTNVTIGESVTTIGNYAFDGCSGLTSIKIPNSVVSIGDYAFQACNTLTDVTIGESVTTIGGHAFSGCSKLKSIEIPNSVTTIGKRAFYNCSEVSSVVIGNSVSTIGQSAFRNCTNLKIVMFNAINCQDFAADNYVFLYCPITKIVIGNTVTRIPTFFTFTRERPSGGGYNDFPLTSLTNLDLGSSVTTIGSYAFNGCSGLANVDFPNSVISIDAYSFCDCDGLTSIQIPNSVASISNYAFMGCNALTSLLIDSNSVANIGAAFISCTNLTNVTIPNSVTFSNSCFSSCTNLNTIYIVGEGEWNAGVLPCNNQITTLCIGSGITEVKGMKVNPLNIYCYATTPPTCDSNSFTDYRGALHVPSASLASYFIAPIWENFSYILGDAVAVQSVQLGNSTLNMSLGEEEELIATIKPSGASPVNITWTTSDASIASVANGIVTAIGVGECDIFASCFDKRAICHVVVNDTISISILLDQQEAMLLPNHIITLTPSIATGDLPDLIVTSSNPTVAAARIVNHTIQVVGIKEGTTTITVGSADGTVLPATCLVTVYTEPGDLNCDGFVNISDVTRLIDCLLSGNYSQISTKNADVNLDGDVTIADVTALIDMLLSGN